MPIVFWMFPLISFLDLLGVPAFLCMPHAFGKMFQRLIPWGLRRALKFTHLFTTSGCAVYDPVYPRCFFVFSGANAHLAVGMYTLYHFVTYVVPVHSPVRVSQHELDYSVRKESGKFNIIRKGPCEMCADGAKT